MREARQNAIKSPSPLHKILAVITATALVASMSNFQAFADQPENPGETVTVRFDIDPGVIVHVKDKDYTSESVDPTVSANSAYNLDFKVEATAIEGTTYMVNGVQYSFGEKQEPVAAPANTVAAQPASAFEGVAGVDASAAEAESTVQDVSIPDESIVTGPDEPIDVQADAESEAEEKAEEAEEASTEPVEDDPTPMADTAAATDTALEGSLEVAEDGTCTVNKDVLGKAAAEEKEVVVKVNSQVVEKVLQVGTWNELKQALSSQEAEKIELTADIEARDQATIKDTKALELNGHTIKAVNMDKKFLFVVPAGAQFSLTDALSTGIEPTAVAQEDSTNDATKLGIASADNKDINANTVAKLGSYEDETKTLTYFVSASETNRAQGTTSETRTQMKVDMAGAGAIVGNGLKALIRVEDTGTFSMTGGRLTNTNGWHAIETASTKSTGGAKAKIFITGGFLVGNGSSSASGAGIFFDGSDKVNSLLTIGGTAVIGGNVVNSTERNGGGGVWATNATITIGGEAVIAGNYAGPVNHRVSSNAGVAYAHPNLCNGGGIYVNLNTDITVKDRAVVAGNRAAGDGGGIYVKPSPNAIEGKPSNKLVISDKANISNNQAQRNMEALNPKNEEKLPTGAAWVGVYSSGGGGVFSMGTTKVESGQIVNNYASDSGGGLLLPGEGGDANRGARAIEVIPELFIEYAVVSGNYCDTSEGGGIFCKPKANLDSTGKVVTGGNSYIHTGYITNNATGTAFDYGGGGLFLESGGYLQIFQPLVTQNTADGWGGGVGACTNGTVITSDAAIFGNTANQKGHTTNLVEYGDRWASDRSTDYWPDQAFSFAGTNTLPDHASDDYFCARESRVYNDMLGGGEYNWKGYMSGKATSGAAQGGDLYDQDGKPAASGSSYYKRLRAKLYSGTPLLYNIYEVTKFPAQGYAEATRFMALTADPTQAAKEAAYKKATVFFTGNYSANNGGGIGCNGKMVIGRDPELPPDPNTPELPEDKYFDLTINKAWSNLKAAHAQNGTLTTAFYVKVYKSKEAYQSNQKPVFETVYGFTFNKDSAAEQQRVVEKIREDYYVVVTELGWSGDNYEVNGSAEAKVVMDGNTTVKFENTYDPEGSYTTGVVNSYAKGEDGEVRVSQDGLYQKRPHSKESKENDRSFLTDIHFELFGN